jgi:hypothetical protein
MRPNLFAVAAVGLAPFMVACGRDSRAAGRGGVAPDALESPRGGCGHMACGKDFFIDAISAGSCTVGDTCSVALTLAATGDYHINDEYPYKFKADDVPAVEFLGTDDGGKNVFSKSAKNWTKTGEKTGAMTVTFRLSDSGSRAIAGVFKFSVCSAQNCVLEQESVKAPVTVHDKPR